jgi:hypothetical protein
LLAMDVNDDAGFLEKRGAHASIASRLAPTMVLCRTQNMSSPQIICGSELARDGVLECAAIIPAIRRIPLHPQIGITPS